LLPFIAPLIQHLQPSTSAAAKCRERLYNVSLQLTGRWRAFGFTVVEITSDSASYRALGARS
jgi:hypothetical protein